MKPENHLRTLFLGEMATCVTAATIVVFRFHDTTLHLTLGLLVGLLAGLCSGVIVGWCWGSIYKDIAQNKRTERLGELTKKAFVDVWRAANEQHLVPALPVGEEPEEGKKS